MVHSVAVGIGKSGKTTLMREIATLAKSHGHGVLVLDPNWGQWDCDYLTDDLTKFMRVAKASRRCLLVMDECGESIARDPTAVWLATRARHWGHLSFFGMHSWTQLLPVIRNQCTTAYVFSQSVEDSAALARHFNDRLIASAAELKQGEFIHKEPFLPAKIKKLDL